MSLKPLGQVKELIEFMGMGISYAYEDLVFLQPNAFLLQFDNSGSAGQQDDHDRLSMLVHTNIEADEQEIKPLVDQLVQAAPKYGLAISRGTTYALSKAENETVSIEFHA
jgi:hypothetical protein